MNKVRLKRVVGIGLIVMTLSSSIIGTAQQLPPDNPPRVILPKQGLEAADLGVIVNDNDPQSVAVAYYYQQKRNIPPQNIIHVNIPNPGIDISSADFNLLRAKVLAATPPDVQAYAITWTTPWRVEKTMSITSAMAFGYDIRRCKVPEVSSKDYSGTYGPDSWLDKYNDFRTMRDSLYIRVGGKDFNYAKSGGRPTMMLAGRSLEHVFDLINRGVASDGTMPRGFGYMVETSIAARSVRAPNFAYFDSRWDDAAGLTVKYIPKWTSLKWPEAIRDKDRVLFYFTGHAVVPDIKTNKYRPGAIADHLTSYGGQLTTSSQMSVLRWLEAGVTGSYGTVVEPKSYTEKFPEASTLIPLYFLGRSLIESYWQSVQWNGEGVFVGEPLASPYKGAKVDFNRTSGELSITLSSLFPGLKYSVSSSDSLTGPFTVEGSNYINPTIGMFTIHLSNARKAYYKIDLQ